MKIENILQSSPEIQAFLASIVDEVTRNESSQESRELVIRELGFLFQERITQYLEEQLDAQEAQVLTELSEKGLPAQGMYEELKTRIPNFDADLKKLCLEFFHDYTN